LLFGLGWRGTGNRLRRGKIVRRSVHVAECDRVERLEWMEGAGMNEQILMGWGRWKWVASGWTFIYAAWKIIDFSRFFSKGSTKSNKLSRLALNDKKERFKSIIFFQIQHTCGLCIVSEVGHAMGAPVVLPAPGTPGKSVLKTLTQILTGFLLQVTCTHSPKTPGFLTYLWVAVTTGTSK